MSCAECDILRARLATLLARSRARVSVALERETLGRDVSTALEDARDDAFQSFDEVKRILEGEPDA